MFFSVSPFSILLRIVCSDTYTRCTAYAAQNRFSAFRWFAFVFFYLIPADTVHQLKSTPVDGFHPCHSFPVSPVYGDEIREIIRLHLHVRCQMGNENCISSSAPTSDCRKAARRQGPAPCINYFNQFHLARKYSDNDDTSRSQSAKFIYSFSSRRRVLLIMGGASALKLFGRGQSEPKGSHAALK